MARKIQLTKHSPKQLVANLEGEHLDHTSYDTVFGSESVDVYKPDGSPLLLFRKGRLPLDICERARPGLRMIGSRKSEKRKLYSGIFGNYDKPDCRKAEFTASDLETYVECLPFVKACSNAFACENRTLQGRYVAQRLMAGETDPQWRIGDSVFTTGTANLWDATHEARTRVHIDDGDLPQGFGVISVLHKGKYTGGYLIFPAFRVAVDMRTTDLLLADVHEYHANAPIEGEPGWERIAVILYYITKMRECPRQVN